MSNDHAAGQFNRRSFLGVAGASAAMPFVARSMTDVQAATPQGFSDVLMQVTLKVNGREHRLVLDPRATLLDALREQLGLTGTKKGCDHGQCGACTVHLDGKRVLSCLTLAATAEGQETTTIEGLTRPDGSLHPMQEAFLQHDGFQCGYCTPGQIMSAVACINEGHAETPGDIRHYMSGNLCRCAAYPNIVDAILDAKAKMGV